MAAFPPGSKGLPLVGEGLSFLVNLEEFFEERNRKYGDIFSANIFGTKTVFLSGRYLNIMGKAEIAGSVGYQPYPNMHNLVMKDTVIDEDVIKAHAACGDLRKQMVRLWSDETLEGHYNLILETVKEVYQDAAVKGDNNVTVNIQNLADDITFKVITAVVLGEEFHSNDRYEEFKVEFEKLSKALVAAPINLPITTYGKGVKASVKLVEILQNIIMETRTQNTILSSDVLKTLLGTGIPDYIVARSCTALLWAGRHATAGRICRVFHDFIENCEARETLIKEVHGTLQRYNDILDHPKLLKKVVNHEMPYLNAFIYEGFRLTNISPIFRKAKSDLYIDGYHIPKDTALVFNTSPCVISEKDARFLPERFLPDADGRTVLKRATFQEQSRLFSSGPNECWGQFLAKAELKISLFLLAAKYSVTMKPGATWPIMDAPHIKIDGAIPVFFRRATQAQIMKDMPYVPIRNKHTTNFIPRTEIPFNMNLPLISMREVAAHDSENDCWMIIDGFVFNVSGFASHHPGGFSFIKDFIGKDATLAFFDDSRHTRGAIEWLRGMCIGRCSTSPSAAHLNVTGIEDRPHWTSWLDSAYTFHSISRYVNTEIISTRSRAEDWFQLRLSIKRKNDKNQVLPIPLPGQHYSFKIALGNGCFPIEVERMYTPVTWDDENIDFVIKLYSKGELSNQLLQLNCLDKIQVRGPIGFPPLEILGLNKYNIKRKTENLTLIAAGSGVVPLISIAQSALQSSSIEMNVKLLIYASEESEIMCREEISKIHQAQRKRRGSFEVFYALPSIGESIYRHFSCGKVLCGRLSKKHILDICTTGSSNLFVICGPATFEYTAAAMIDSMPDFHKSITKVLTMGS